MLLSFWLILCGPKQATAPPNEIQNGGNLIPVHFSSKSCG